MTPFEYRLLAGDPSTKYGEIKKFPDVPGGDWNLHEGLPLAPNFQPSVTWSIAPNSGNLIGDFVKNLGDMLILSRRARDLFEAEGIYPPVIEYLPFILKNKKGRVVDSAEYCLANPLRKVMCLDRSRSNFVATPDGDVAAVNALEVDVAQIPNDLKVFRLGEYPRITILRSDLIERCKTAELKGLYTLNMGDDL